MLIGILTVSDRCSQGLAVDTAGPSVAGMVKTEWLDAQVETALVPDEEPEIVSQLSHWKAAGAALVLTVGGTGLGPRDLTPEASRQVIDREAPGLAEAMRARGAEQNPYAWLSRGVAGLAGSTLVVNLPGSKRGATESLSAILPLLRHGLETVAGGKVHP